MAFRLAKSSQCRPSDVYAVDDPVDAYCFDRAVYHFGTALEAALDEANSEKTAAAVNRKRQRIFQKWIPEASVGFADPAKKGI